MKIRSLISYGIVVIVSTLITSCSEITSDLSHLNKNPDALEELNSGFMFTNAQLGGAYNNYGSGHGLFGQSLQYFASQREVAGTGDKYINEGGARDHWSIYTGPLREIQAIIREVSEASEDVNKLSAARIWKVYLFHVITDFHGDIPYSEALKIGEDINQPKYDTQEDIYIDMLNELEEAANAFDPNLPTFGNADLFYGGNTVQWQQFAYSLMLRLGMRLTEVREDLAEEYVKKAIAGGVITQDSDIASVAYTSSGTEAERNPKTEFLLQRDYQNPYERVGASRRGEKYSKTFIDHLKNTNDPRLTAISVVWRPSDNPGVSGEYFTDPEMQQGLESGVHLNTPANFTDLSEPHPHTVLSRDAPIVVMSNAEVNLLLSEAALRGWYSGSEEEAYNNAVRADMREWALFGSDGVISADRINTYLTENPYKIGGSFEERLEQINTQKWITLFLNPFEAHSNWRRTGYPDLTPANYPGNLTGGTIPRRMIIPDSEIYNNEKNFREALERQGVDNYLTSTVWWDPMHPQQQLN